MEFLVEMQVNLPPDVDPGRLAELRVAEAARSRELLEAGAIVRIWRLPGRTANVGVWEARDGSELHALVASLPLFPWLDVTVSALAEHPTEAAEHAGQSVRSGS
ncbi:MAG: muconolactone delta-isomerase [Streptosporangiales bacterium]|nr:muconolactone delta-isomerase [Streptosporangiales bacterium]